MYETYLQNEREFDEEFTSSSDFCSCMEGDMYDQFPDGIKALKSKNRLSLIKVMKTLEKELEGERKDDKSKTLFHGLYAQVAYNKGLQLSLDKIREFISKLEQV